MREFLARVEPPDPVRPQDEWTRALDQIVWGKLRAQVRALLVELETKAREREEGEHENETEQTEIELWPEEGEKRSEFMERCTIELEKCIGDRAEEVCDEKWHQSRTLGTKGFVVRSKPGVLWIRASDGIIKAAVSGDLAINSCGDTCVCGGDPKSSHARLDLPDLLIADKDLDKRRHEPEPNHGRREEAGRLDPARAEAGRERNGAASRSDGGRGDRGSARSRDVRGFDPSEPRDERGRWTEGGGSDGGDDDIAIPSEHIAGTYKRGGITVHALTADGNEQFHDAISSAKAANKYGASVHVYEPEEYRNVKMFLTPDGLAGLAVKPDGDIVSVFKGPNSPLKAGFAEAALSLATQQGGNKLDAFDTVLPGLYGANGFRAVARLAWNDQYAPDGWDKATFAKFNGGEPDVVFMVHDPAHAQDYKPGDGARVSTYEEGVAAQAAALQELSKSGAAAAEVVDPSKPIDVSSSKQISSGEKQSIAKYQSKGGFKKINKPLREGGEPSADAKNLSAVISKHSLAKDVTVYRGMGKTVSKQLLDAWEHKEAGKPIVFADKGFLSTSRSRGAAATFSNQIFQLVIPKGHNALPLPAAKGMGGEAEILLDRGDKFKLVDVVPGVTAGSRLFKVELVA